MLSKLFPFWWLNPVVTCDVVKGCLEGVCTTWTYQDKVEVDQKGAEDEVSLTVDDLGNVHFYNSGAETTYKIYDDELAQVFGVGQAPGCNREIPGGASGGLWFVFQSLRLKYTVMLDCTGKELFVYRNSPIVEHPEGGWTHLFTRALSSDWADVGALYCVSISPNGEYIVVYADNSAGDAAYLLLYRGS